MASVSVIVPVHNMARYLENTVHSISGQDMEDLEIILVENLSTDNSYEICKNLAGEDSRIKIFRLDRSGLSIARNAGIDAASSDFVCFIDGDDTIEPDMISAMYNALSEKGGVCGGGEDICICNYMLKHPDGRVEYPYEETGKTRHCTSIEMLVELLTEKVCSSACVMLCRKSLFSSVRFPVGRYFEDHAVTYLLVNAAKNGCVHIGKSYYHY